MFKLPMESVYAMYRKLVVNPKYRWWIIGATLAYVLNPIDIAPDFIPFIGEIDDAVVVSLLVTELVGALRDRMAATKTGKMPTAVADTEFVEAVAVEVM
jgi:uncharacterized membrane protein YkvA (DUF1232 family)